MGKTYDPNVDYSKKMEEAAAHGDLEQAAYYEEKRNEKIKGEGLSQYSLTHKYEEYLPKTTEKKMEDIFQKLQSREPFSYDLAGDKLYEKYKKEYSKTGSLAREDAVAQASGLTGGYGNSYGQTLGQQAYEGVMSGLESVASELYDRALDAYVEEGDALWDQYSALAKELDAQRKAESEEYDRQLAAEKLEYDRQLASEKLDYDRKQEQQEQALNLALSMLTQGLMPSETVLDRSGLEKGDVEALYEANRTELGMGGTGSGSSGGSSGSGSSGSGSGGSSSSGSGSGGGSSSGSQSGSQSGSKTDTTDSGGKTPQKELTNTLWEKLRTAYRNGQKNGDMSDFIQLRSMLVAQGYGVQAFDTWGRQTYGKDYTTGAPKTIHWDSVLALGYGAIGEDRLKELVAAGEIIEYTRGDYIYYMKNTLNLPDYRN